MIDRLGRTGICLWTLLYLAGCGGGESDPRAARLKVPEANEWRVLLVNNGAEPRDLDPQTVSGIPEVRIIRSVIEGLVSPGPTNDEPIIPGVASHWEMSADGRTWTFHLRPDARWSNGDPVTAEDFIFAWRRAVEPRLACEYADWLYIIEGAEAYHLGEGPWEAVGLEAPDPHTFVVRLRQPTADFLEILTNHTFLPVLRGNVEAHGPADVRQTGWTGELVANGPFRLVEWRENVRIRVEKNPHYWNAGNVWLEGIHFFPIESEMTEGNAFESGDLHLTSTVPVNRIAYYRDRDPEVIRFDDYAGVYFFRLNLTRPGLEDPRVRHALSLALDREVITTKIKQGGERPAFGYTPDGVGGYRTPRPLRHDPVEGRRLLAEAGYPGGAGFPDLALLFNTSENHRTIAEAVQQMWRTELGIEVTLTNMEWKVYLDTCQAMNYDIARAGWIGSSYPYSFLRNYESTSPNNETGYADPEYDALVHRGRHTLDFAERMRMLRAAEDRLLEALPVIPIYWYKRVYLIRREVHGWEPKFDDMRPYGMVQLHAFEP